MNAPVNLYAAPEDLYRAGAAKSPGMDKVRSTDITVDEQGNVEPDGMGVSLYTKEGINQSGLSGYAWCLKAGITLPSGLVLVNDKPEHYAVGVAYKMSFENYVIKLRLLGGLMEKGGKIA